MHQLHFDLNIFFRPIMNAEDPGITLTRQLELPFVPQTGVALYSGAWGMPVAPAGYPLLHVTWDVDRSIFLAWATRLQDSSTINTIFNVLRECVKAGWRIGSFLDLYLQKQDTIYLLELAQQHRARRDQVVEPRLRMPAANTDFRKDFLKAVVRHMVAVDNNVPVAYAIDQMGDYHGPGSTLTPGQSAEWDRHVWAYEQQSNTQLNEWPTLGHLVLGDASCQAFPRDHLSIQ